MAIKERPQRAKLKDTSGLTMILSAEDRERLHRITRLVNEVLGTKLSQASIIRRSVLTYERWLEDNLGQMALNSPEQLPSFVRAEKSQLYRTNGLRPDGKDPWEHLQAAGEKVKADLKDRVAGMTPEEARAELFFKPKAEVVVDRCYGANP